MDIVLKDIPLEQLLNEELNDKLIKIKNALEQVQNSLYILADNEDNNTLLKSITVITFALIKKGVEGKNINQLDRNDFKDIVKTLDYYLTIEDDQYTKFVFNMYENFIISSCQAIVNIAPEEKISAIYNIADEINKNTELFDNNIINEVQYIEECLWLSLEAMIKLISASIYRFINKDNADLINALNVLAFEYGRYVLYKKENEILNEYIQSQYKLDKELEIRYKVFLENLEKQSNEFFTMIDNAFVPDFKERFLSSVLLARKIGIDENEIIKDINDIDLFFM